MPTIANLPGADIAVDFPDGKVRTVNMIRLLVQAQNAEFKAKYGQFLPGVNKLHPTVKQLREAYPGIITAKTWAEAAEQLRGLHTMLAECIKAQSEAATLSIQEMRDAIWSYGWHRAADDAPDAEIPAIFCGMRAEQAVEAQA